MTLVVLLIVMTFLALLVRLIPGDPTSAMIGLGEANPEVTAQLRREMGVDQPAYRQVGSFSWRLLHGDLGRDVISGVPVRTQIVEALPHTLVLTIGALAIALAFGVVLGVLGAARPRSLLDNAIGAVSISIVTIPSYVASLFFLLLFVVHWQWFPAIGTGSFSHPGDYIRHLILPMCALATSWAGLLSRLVRASLLEVLGQNYIRAAEAAGVGSRKIYFKYALKNALVPTVAVLGVGLGNLLGGAIFVETIFARFGVGTVLVRAIQQRDFPVIRGTVFVIALLFIAANLLADLMYRYLNPRIRAQGVDPA